MANLRANRITSTEVFETTGSVQFDGSGGYLSLASSDNFGFETGDFTVECWVYLTSNISDNISIAGPMIVVGATNGLWIGNYQGNFVLRAYGISNLLTTSYPPLNQWVHIAVTRNNSIARIFFNGVLQNSGTVTQNFAQSNLYVGSDGPGVSPAYTTGHISNLRILKGTALYTSNFTPPTRELTAIPNTVLLACQSTTNAAEEKTGKTITVNGNAVANELTPGLLTNVVKSGGSSAITGSVFFDGNDDLVVPDSDDFHLNGNYTIECFINRSLAPASEVDFISKWGGSDRSFLLYINSSGKFGYAVSNDGTNVTNYGAGNTVIGAHEWHHLAVTNDGTTVRIFVNGILEQSGATVTMFNSTRNLVIGAETSQGSFDLQGFISNLRIIKGTALYTSNFIPPTRKLTRLPGTVLLCCQDSNNPTAEATGKTITGYGSLDRQDIGVELVTNGTFDTDVSGWTVGGGTFTSVSARAQHITTGNAPVNQLITVKIGNQYRFSYVHYSGYTSAYISTAGNSDSSILSLGDAVGTGPIYRTAIFTATQSSYYVTIYGIGNTTSTYDDVSVIKLDPGPKPPFVPQIGSDGSVVFDGTTKINTENYFYLPTGPTENRAPVGNYNAGTRGLFGGGRAPGEVNVIDYITIATTGNAQDFGDLTQARTNTSSFSSSTRGVWATGYGAPSARNIIDYVTISSTGNAVDFGDTTIAGESASAGCSNTTRGVFAVNGATNILEYVTIASTGNSQDFGDLLGNISEGSACSSPIRGVFFSGQGNLNAINYITISTTGNAQDFGDCLRLNSRGKGGSSNSIRGVFGGGYNQPAIEGNIIEYITISTTGNSIDFGDLSYQSRLFASAANSIRAVFSGGVNTFNNIEYVTISTNSNSTDFGDLTAGRHAAGGLSNGHGGLG